MSEAGHEVTRTDPADTLTGATSADVNKGLGRLINGQTSSELHHDGQHTRSRQKLGLAKVGASKGAGFKGVDERVDKANVALNAMRPYQAVEIRVNLLLKICLP